jgi:hypothetical protein
MTKSVRIENADTSNYKVVVEVWEGDTKIKEVDLNYPTSLVTEMIHNTRYLIIRENGTT